MCGITCIYNLDETLINTSQLEQITNEIKHRGPDDEGYLCIDTNTNQIEFAFGKDTHPEIKKLLKPLSQVNDVNLGFGFRRLSIQDLSVNGHQPMTDFTKKIFIVFNGEIYNFIELRDELECRGYHFNSKTDTEVILNAYLEWGEACVERFNGMWAFAIWDSRSNKLFCSRDRFGIKPFYYFNLNGQFVFASEIKALIKLVETEVNTNTLYRYLYFNELDISEETFFKDILKLPAGYNLVIESKEIRIKEYYRINEKIKFSNKTKFSGQDLREKFSNSINLRLRSDVPVGFALSGGLDSSSIVCVADSIYKNKNWNTFSIVYPNEEIDESEFIDEVNLKTGFKNYKLSPTAQDLKNDLKAFVYSQEEPVPDLSYYNEYKLKELIQNKGIIVALEGQGADEIISGYRSFLIPYLFDLLDSFQFIKVFDELKAFGHLLQVSKTNLIFRYVFEKLPFSWKIFIKNRFKRKNSLINSNYFTKTVKEKSSDPKHQNFLTKALISSLKKYSLPKQLIRADKSAMAFSLESRFPFLDHGVVEYVLSLPNSKKMNNGITKVILREELKGLLPKKILDRKDKKGFLSPQSLWIKNLSEVFDSVVYSEKFKKCPYVNWQNFEYQYTLIKNNPKTSSKEVWKILSVFFWEQEYFNK